MYNDNTVRESSDMHREKVRRNTIVSEENTSTQKEATAPLVHDRTFVSNDHREDT